VASALIECTAIAVAPRHLPTVAAMTRLRFAVA
jgi:hypothetical protein